MGNKIPIDQMLIWMITILPYQGQNPTEEFLGKDQDHAMADNMKNKYGLVRGNMGYDIKSISDQAVCFATHILAENIMRKCRTIEFPVSVVSLAAQCANGFQYKWDGYLCKEFLDDCLEVHEKGTYFHYA